MLRYILVDISSSTAASALRNHPVLIKTASEARKLRGIGESISSKIPEIVKACACLIFSLTERYSSTFASLADSLPFADTHRRILMNSRQESDLSDFCDIYGVGRSTAGQLWDAEARSLGDVEADPTRYNLSKNQKLGLRY